ncbi:MAG: hypothetical protein R2844_09160 [Caldilineales bacterium]
MRILRRSIHIFLVVCAFALIFNSSGMMALASFPTPPIVGTASTAQFDSSSTVTPLAVGIVGQYGGEAQSVAVAPDGNTAFVGVGRTVAVVDLRAEPVQVGVSEILPDQIVDLAVKGETIYAVVQREGLWVIGVSDPTHPVVTGYITADRASGVTVAGNYLYLAGNDLTILDISRPLQPVQVGHLPLSGRPRGLAVAGGYAYVATGDGLQIVDVSTPMSPIALGYTGAPGSWSVAATNGYAYVSRVDSGFDVVDVANPAAPVVVAQVELRASYDISATSKTVFVVGSHGLSTFDITDPLHPTPTGLFDTYNESFGLVVRDNMAYVAARSDGFYVADTSDLTSHKNAGTFRHAGSGRGHHCSRRLCLCSRRRSRSACAQPGQPAATH